jgi:hypothetical protein
MPSTCLQAGDARTRQHGQRHALGPAKASGSKGARASHSAPAWRVVALEDRVGAAEARAIDVDLPDDALAHQLRFVRALRDCANKLVACTSNPRGGGGGGGGGRRGPWRGWGDNGR